MVPTIRLLLIERGTVAYHRDGERWDIAGPALLLVPALAKRWWHAEGGQQLTMGWVEFLAHLPDAAEVGLPALAVRLDEESAACESEAFARLAAALRREDAAGRLLAEAELRAVLARLLTAGTAQASSSTAHDTGADPAIRAAIAWLHRHFSDRSPERGLAQRVGLSADHFRQRFKVNVGANPRAFVLDLRLHAARRLLAAGSLSIKEVAAMVGYPDALHFSRLYRRRWGVPPSADRE